MLIMRLIANMYSDKFVYYTWTSSYITNMRHATHANAMRSYEQNDLSFRWQRSMNSQKRCDYNVDWYVLTHQTDNEFSLEKNDQAFLKRMSELFFVIKYT